MSFCYVFSTLQNGRATTGTAIERDIASMFREESLVNGVDITLLWVLLFVYEGRDERCKGLLMLIWESEGGKRARLNCERYELR